MLTPEERDGLHVQSMEQFQNAKPLPESAKYEGPRYASEMANTDTQYSRLSKTTQDAYPHRRNPFGLSPLAFGALVMLMTALIVGGAIGAGLGAVLDEKKHCSAKATGAPSTSSLKPSNSASPTSNAPTALFNYVVPDPTLIQSLYVDCPKLTGSVIGDTALGWQYKVTCGSAIQPDDGISQMTELVAYTLEDCVTACTELRYWASLNCSAVTWNSAMADNYEDDTGGNCYLYNSSTTWSVIENSTMAVLQLDSLNE